MTFDYGVTGWSNVGTNKASYSIAVDSNGYKGTWRVGNSADGYQNSTNKRTSIKLAPGDYWVKLAYHAQFLITVKAKDNDNCEITSQSGSLVNGVVNTLKFDTETIKVVRKGYTATEIGIHNGPKLDSDDKVVLVKGVEYALRVAYNVSFPFLLDKNGKIDTTNSGKSAFESNKNELNLNTATIKIDPGRYDARKVKVHYGPSIDQNNGICVVKDLKGYSLAVAHNAVFPFDVDANGDVDTNSVAADPAGKVLRLNTTDIEINRNGFNRNLHIHTGPSIKRGNNVVTLVKGVSNYTLVVVKPGHRGFPFHVTKSGDVSVEGSVKCATAEKKVLKLNTVEIDIQGLSNTTWNFKDWGWQKPNVIVAGIPFENFAATGEVGRTKVSLNFKQYSPPSPSAP